MTKRKMYYIVVKSFNLTVDMNNDLFFVLKVTLNIYLLYSI